jgi:hypothetical protein
MTPFYNGGAGRRSHNFAKPRAGMVVGLTRAAGFATIAGKDKKRSHNVECDSHRLAEEHFGQLGSIFIGQGML